MTKLLAPLLALVGLLLLGQGAAAQSEARRVVAGPDGTLYVLTDAGRYTLVPGEVSDDDLAGLADLGTLEADLPGAPAAVLAGPPDVDQPTAGPAPEPQAGPPPGPAAEPPLSLMGPGTLVTRPFGLRGGDYDVTWSAQTSNPECNHSATLHSVDDNPNVLQPLGGGQVSGGGGSGRTSLHDLPPGNYFVDVTSTCRWTITVTPHS